ncbi:hypothetical protein E6W39_18885 [Kitasatospora acidiphila]|uniref:Uncharacterized protein n=1 Tax=Kitasatospora acidiphila TaxID=2567942 RepID=A0A540W4F9_9ACTN|nr:hypothetical protein [Kitasatospora acidiphila]TQF03919.1 hypothetical protein E6W39_18885 [Kitasatospora acidiphila]
MFSINYNRTTNHIAGLNIRTAGGGIDKGDRVSYYAQNACGSLTRGNLAEGPSFKTAREALDYARIPGGRKLCTRCEKAALAMIEAEETIEAPEVIETEPKGAEKATEEPVKPSAEIAKPETPRTTEIPSNWLYMAENAATETARAWWRKKCGLAA